jgi:hypothetical protein
MTRGEINVDPIEGEFFSTDILGSLSDALIREAIQNSLDAAVPGQQVKVVITFSSPDQKLPPAKFEHYLKGLREHLEAKGSGLLKEVRKEEPLDFILIEDFGTRGLEGDFRDDGDLGNTEVKNDFFYFWRNIGRAVEGTTTRGRWGLGKTVFQAASRINSFFGLTIPRKDARRLLMGQAVLKIHRIEGKRFAPYGYCGTFEGDFALPIQDGGHIEKFCQDFYLRRKDEAGLSVIIPYPDSEIVVDGVIRAAINQYFFPILSGDLVVIISSGPNEKVLDAESIFSFVSSTSWEDKKTLIERLEFARWCLSIPGDGFERLQEPTTGQAPKWEESLFQLEQLKRLRNPFEVGDRMALLAPLWVKRAENPIEHSCFKLFIERDPDLERGEDYFIRDGVTVSGVSSLRQKGWRVIVSVSDRPLSRLLGDSENPAHTEWQERSFKFRGRYDLGVSCLRYVKNSPREIFKILSRPPEGRDLKVLQDLFYVDLPKDSPGSTPRPSPKPGVELGEIIVDGYFQIIKVKTGFRLAAKPNAKALLKEATLEVSYDVREGNPFKRYKKFDFQLDKPPIRMKATGVKVQIPKPNMLFLFPEKKDFQLNVTGFDPNRDLKIRTLPSVDEAL